MPTAKFSVGTAVRVKSDTLDADFPDVPLDGWEGTIQEADPPMFLVRWNMDTLQHMSLAFRTRCEGADLELETMWLDESDLELSPAGETSGLIDEPNREDEEVHSPLAQIGESTDSPHGKPGADLANWLRGWQAGGQIPQFLPWIQSKVAIPKKWMTARLVFLLLCWTTLGGVVLGSILATNEFARYFALSGATVFGLLGLWIGWKVGSILGRLFRMRSASWRGGILGAMVGVLLGTVLGAMSIEFLGVMIGGFAGATLSEWFWRRRKRLFAIFLGSMVGATVQALLLNHEQAALGGLGGGAIGIGAGVLMLIGLRVVAARARRR